MADQSEFPHRNGADEPENLNGHDRGSVTVANGNPSIGVASADPQSYYNIGTSINDNDNKHHATTNNSTKSPILSEIDPNSFALASDGSPKQLSTSQVNSKADMESDRVECVGLADEEGVVNPNIEQIFPEGEENEVAEDADQANEGAGIGVAKKKKKKKPKSKRGLNAPTGFEEFYVDAPLTPAEYEEEKKIYKPYYAFAQRIETAIQRFAAKRNMDSARKNLFDKYLVHGGVEGGQKMFSGGLEAGALSRMNAAEIKELSATNYVGGDKGGPDDTEWVVDFDGCLKSFLSTRYPGVWELTDEATIKDHVNIIRNFLNYLLHHDVCPEYNSQINAARALCDKAQKDLWQIAQLLPILPGDFNMACSIIFGGMYQGIYEANLDWMDDEEKANAGMNPELARRVFKFALAANANDDIFYTYKKRLAEKTCRITSTEEIGLEVTEILLPNDEARTLYAQQQCTGLKTVGKLKAKTWILPDAGADEDLTEEEEVALATKVPEIKHYEFWIEEEVLQKMFIGMKISTKVTHLSFGVSFFDAITGVFCSFYQRSPNSLMDGWREPEKEWLPPRPKSISGEGGEGVEVYENQGPETSFAEGETVGEKEAGQRASGATQLGPKDDNDFENYFLTAKNGFGS